MHIATLVDLMDKKFLGKNAGEIFGEISKHNDEKVGNFYWGSKAFDLQGRCK